MGSPSIDARAWLQELKGNRRTQAMLLVLVAVLTYTLWPDSPKPRARRASGAAPSLGERKLQGLEKLPDLVKLDRAGQLPHGDRAGRMYRDLFVFDLPAGPPPPPPKPLPPPPPPTPEQLRAQELQRARDAEASTRPQQLRYLGWFGNASSGRLGAFMQGEEALTLRLGAVLASKWKLITLTEDRAEFQNLKYPDLRHQVRAVEAGPASGAAPSNQY